MLQSAADLAQAARDGQIKRTPQQIELTAKWLKPVAPQLFEKATAYRRLVDEEFRKNHPISGKELSLAVGEIHPSLYPLGYCRLIRDEVWTHLSNDPLIKKLRSRGLLWKKVYFILESRCFQNSIQCGDYLLDVAEDTLDVRYAPIDLSPLDTWEYENLEDWSRYAAIAEIYYGLKIYPNFYFPLIFPLVPFLAVRSTGRIDLLYQQDTLFFMDLGENWRRAQNLLKDSSWMQRRLPADYETLLQKLCEKNEFEIFPLEFRKCTIEQLSQSLDEWQQVSALKAEPLLATVKKIREVVHLAAMKLRQAGLRPDFNTLESLCTAGDIPKSNPNIVLLDHFPSNIPEKAT